MRKKMGFRSINPEAMTNAERQSRWRRKQGSRKVQVNLDPAVAAAILYIRREWGIPSNAEAVKASLRFLALCTRQGLTRLPQTIDD